MAKPDVLILRAPGTNCDHETAFACEQAGARAERIHLLQLRSQPRLLRRFQLLILPGGFSFGDDVGGGTILASQLAWFLRDALHEFRSQEKLILGICNGFQALLKAGLLLPHDQDDGPLATLTRNQHGRFLDRWVHLHVNPGNCPFLLNCQQLYLPIAHGEGRFVAREPWILRGLEQSGQAVLRYTSPDGTNCNLSANPNGSQGEIAGICDVSGRVLGLMPHPERHILFVHHPQWTRRDDRGPGDGLQIFRNAIHYFTHT